MLASDDYRAACAKLPYRFPFVADCQATGRFRCDEDRVTHFPTRTTVLGFNFLPKPKASKFEFRKFFFDLPAQAIFIAFSRPLAPSGKHPKPVALSSYEKHPSAFRSHQFRGFRHSLYRRIYGAPKIARS